MRLYRQQLYSLYAQQISCDGNLGEVVAVKDEPKFSHPNEITLLQNYPNPFNSSTIINFNLPQATEVRIGIFDINGRDINVGALREAPLHQYYPAGHHQITFDASDLASGIYLYRLTTITHTATRKMVLIK